MKFSCSRIVFLGFGSLGLSVIWVIYNSFVPVFLQERFSLSPAGIGFFMSIDNIAAIMILPFIGAWSDRVRTPIGRRMPFIAAGVPAAAIAFYFIPRAAVLPFFVLSTITLILSMAVWRTPLTALLADITPSPYRSQANGISNFMGGIGGVAAAVGGGALFSVNQAYPFCMASFLIIAAGLMLFIFIREPACVDYAVEEKPELIKSVKLLFRDPDKNALRVFFAHFFWIIALSSLEAFFTLYAKNHLGYEGGDGSRILGQFPLMLILFALPAGFIGAGIGRKTSIISGLIILSASLLSAYFLDRDFLTAVITTIPALGTVPVIGGILMISGCAWMLVNVNSLAMIFDMTDPAHAGTYTGIAFLFITAAAIAGPNINGWIINMTGNNYSLIYLSSSMFIFISILLMSGVHGGEAQL